MNTKRINENDARRCIALNMELSVCNSCRVHHLFVVVVVVVVVV